MSPQIVIWLLLVAAGFGSAWKVQSWRMDAKEKEYVEQVLADERSAAKTALRRAEAVIEAQNAATVRVAGLRRDADGSRAALVGLSGAVDQALRDATASQTACTERAATLGKLFVTSTEKYRGMAEIAGRHASDVKTLIDGWPGENRPADKPDAEK